MDRDRILNELIELNAKLAEDIGKQLKSAKTPDELIRLSDMFCNLAEDACRTIALQRKLALQDRQLQRLRAVEARPEPPQPALPHRKPPKRVH